MGPLRGCQLTRSAVPRAWLLAWFPEEENGVELTTHGLLAWCLNHQATLDLSGNGGLHVLLSF